MEKEIPYMEKLWNFHFDGKKACVHKKWGKICPDFDVSMFIVASVITSPGLALLTSQPIALAYCWTSELLGS